MNYAALRTFLHLKKSKQVSWNEGYLGAIPLQYRNAHDILVITEDDQIYVRCEHIQAAMRYQQYVLPELLVQTGELLVYTTQHVADSWHLWQQGRLLYVTGNYPSSELLSMRRSRIAGVRLTGNEYLCGTCAVLSKHLFSQETSLFANSIYDRCYCAICGQELL